MREIELSKRLSYILRHSTVPHSDGWVEVALLVEQYHFLAEKIYEIVQTDEKGRFELSDDKTRVRAIYGHSNHVHIQMQPLIPPAVLYHGTSKKAVEQITQEGIIPRSRQYVHLSVTPQIAAQVGARHGEPFVFQIDTSAMARDGYQFYKATDNIWLTREIPTQYIIK